MHKTSIKIYTETTPTETLLPIVYTNSYSVPEVKQMIHAYKFKSDLDIKRILTDQLIDMYIDQLTKDKSGMAVHIFTCPPSTMYARKEKKEDSMWSLLTYTDKILPFYISLEKRLLPVCTCQIFSIRSSLLKKKKAQHIDGDRLSRIKDMDTRYKIRRTFKLKLFLLLLRTTRSHITFTIIDDVASTGATLLATKKILTLYLEKIQKKKPALSFNIQVFSLAH